MKSWSTDWQNSETLTNPLECKNKELFTDWQNWETLTNTLECKNEELIYWLTKQWDFNKHTRM